MSNDNAKRIWNYLVVLFDSNKFAAAGMMGNLYAESALNPKNLQQTFEKKLGMTDDQYTNAVDTGLYSKDSFINDKAGYGLAQWTYYSRKQGLIEFAQWQNVSIGDLSMQLDYLAKELRENYAGLVKELKACTSVQQASDLILTKFERPADQSDKVKALRGSYSMNYYNTFGKEVEVSKAEFVPKDRYNSVEEMPEHYQKEMNEIKSLISIGRGANNTILDLSEDMIRILILCFRLIKAMLKK